MADEIVRLRRGRRNTQPWLVPGQATRQLVIVLLLARERSRPSLASVPRTT